MVGAGEGLVHHPVVAFEGCRGIAIEWSADFIGKLAEIDVLGMEDAIAVGEVVHGLLRLLAGGGWRFGIALDAAGGEAERQGEKQDDGFHGGRPYQEFSSLSQRLASRLTFFGAVPPKLVREATEFSTVRTL